MRPAHSPYSLRAPSPRLLVAAAAWALGITALPLHAAPPADQTPAAAAAAMAPSAPLFDPAAPTRPLTATPMATGKAVVNADDDWKAANTAVARFPRGHADIVRWEKNQAGTPQPGKPPAAEHAQHPEGQP